MLFARVDDDITLSAKYAFRQLAFCHDIHSPDVSLLSFAGVTDGVNPRKNDGEIRQPKSEDASGAIMIFKDFAWFRTL